MNFRGAQVHKFLEQIKKNIFGLTRHIIHTFGFESHSLHPLTDFMPPVSLDTP